MQSYETFTLFQNFFAIFIIYFLSLNANEVIISELGSCGDDMPSRLIMLIEIIQSHCIGTYRYCPAGTYPRKAHSEA